MKRSGVALFPPAELLSQQFIAWWQRGKALKERSKIKPGPAGHDRKTSAGGDPRDYFPSCARIITSRETVLCIRYVKEMVGYGAAGGSRRLGRADIEAAIQLEGVAIDDFT